MNRCSLCPGINACVPPSGPESDELEFIGEAPGKDENKRGVPFIGKTGREVDGHYLPAAGLDRQDCHFNNAIKCLPPGDGRLDSKKRQHKELLASCAETHLYPYLQRVQPKLVVPMGAFACTAIEPDISLDLHHGFPMETAWGTAFPMFHPAGGIHEPKKMLQIRTDWIRLRRYLNGSLYLPHDEFPEPDYQEVTDVREIRDIDPTIPMASDTESSRKYGPYCLTYSQYPGVGRLIRASRPDLLAELQKKLDRWDSILLFHNWLYDKKVTADMKLVFPDRLVRDTMVRVFHLGNLPQGLKALAFRELGMLMQDFEDLVKPYSTIEVLKYYREAYAESWAKPDEQVVRDEEGKWKLYKPQSMSTKLKRFFTDLSKKPDKDVFEMWTKGWIESHAMIEDKIGIWPGMDIAHVPFDRVIHYACRDSDATLRLWPILEHMMEGHRSMRPQENWRN